MPILIERGPCRMTIARHIVEQAIEQACELPSEGRRLTMIRVNRELDQMIDAITQQTPPPVRWRVREITEVTENDKVEQVPQEVLQDLTTLLLMWYSNEILEGRASITLQ